MFYDFATSDYYQGACSHKGVARHSIIEVKRGGTPDLRCKSGATGGSPKEPTGDWQGCGKPLTNVTRIRPRRSR